jgi:hypothetical protein
MKGKEHRGSLDGLDIPLTRQPHRFQDQSSWFFGAKNRRTSWQGLDQMSGMEVETLWPCQSGYRKDEKEISDCLSTPSPLRSCSWSSRASKEKHTWSSIREKFVDER